METYGSHVHQLKTCLHTAPVVSCKCPEDNFFSQNIRWGLLGIWAAIMWGLACMESSSSM